MWLQLLERETVGRRAMLGLNLSYEVLGHLVQDGNVVGLVLEASKGRMVEYRDRAKVYRFNAVQNFFLHDQGLRCFFSSNTILCILPDFPRLTS